MQLTIKNGINMSIKILTFTKIKITYRWNKKKQFFQRMARIIHKRYLNHEQCSIVFITKPTKE